MQKNHLIFTLSRSACAFLITALVPPAWAAQVSVLGHTGGINTPTAEVLAAGAAAFAISNSVPEWKQLYKTQGVFGGLTAGISPFPGLELFGRLTYDGDLQCNQYLPGCNSRTRDLSLNAKYQLPLKLPLDTRVAFGATDFGGAAPNFRQGYVVATSQLGPVDVSIGKSNGNSPAALMHGVFGSAEVHITRNWAVSWEDDTRARRLGTHYTAPLTQTLDLQVGVSKRLSGNTDQKSAQLTATVRYVPDDLRTSKEKPTAQYLWDTTPLPQTDAGDNASRADGESDASTHATDGAAADRMLALLEAAGFTGTTIAVKPAQGTQPKLWRVITEPSGWRKNALDAVRVVLPIWARTTKQNTDQLLLTVTYLQQTKLSAAVSRGCVDGLRNGQLMCAEQQPLQFYWGESLPHNLRGEFTQTALPALVRSEPTRFKPQLELGIDLRSTVGTEYGLADYALALDIGGELPLGKGWSLQGNGVVPLSASEDFQEGGIFYSKSQQRTEFRQGLLSHWRNVEVSHIGNVAVQVSAGAIKSSSVGGQLDAVWQNAVGDWRVGGSVGAYRQRLNLLPDQRRTPAMVSVRHTLAPGRWQMEAIVGRFFGGDTGFRINSHHWLGAQRLTLYFRSSGGQTTVMPKTNFAGFELSFPFGGGQSTDVGWASFRGRDRFAWGLATKVGDTNNNLTQGYGEMLRPRHGVWTDVLDYDRSGPLELVKNWTKTP